MKRDYSENGSSVFEELEELPVGSECVFRGAAAPPDREQWPSFCLDAANVVYSTTSCHTTGWCIRVSFFTSFFCILVFLCI